MPGTLMGAHIGLWFGSDMVLGVGISCVPPTGFFKTSKTNSVSYFQLLKLLTLSLSPTWLITNSGRMWRAANLDSNVPVYFALVMVEDSYRLTDELLGWANLLVPLVGWGSPSICVLVKNLQYSSRIGIVDEPSGWYILRLGLPLSSSWFWASHLGKGNES